MNEAREAQWLFLRNGPEKAELALVFGHHAPEVAASRARHAAWLYHAGFAQALLLSGGSIASRTSEAAFMARIVREAGVPEGDVLLEESSRNTFQNAEYSLLLLRERDLLDQITKVLLVSCPWHMRRVFLVTEQTFPARIRLLACPHDEACTESTWRGSAACRECVVTELGLLERFARAGLLRF
jgi:uncharacterized SAM-binding protein YcdF (DUF218 family)